MSQPTRINPEGFTTRPSEAAWGCTAPKGWVPFPHKIPRRHPLLDTVGRIDDPCARPKIEAPDWRPMPAFKPPREGYPNDVCRMEDYEDERGQRELPQGSVLVNVGENTPQSIHVKLPPMYNECNEEEGEPGAAECCQKTRSLDTVKEKYNEIIGPLQEREAGHEVQWAKCQSPCKPLLPGYPCRGVIPDRLETFPLVPPEKQCQPISLQRGEKHQDWREQTPINGWEFIDGCKTCDFYPIDADLPGRFNNPAWFKGYGSDKPIHPFYVTTGADYGRFGPNPHTMTQKYYPRSSAFTEVLSLTGMYRNRTLNTSNAKTVV